MKSAKIYTNDLNRLIAATKSFVSDNDHRPCNQYIKLEFHAPDNQVVAMAVDGYRMSVEHSDVYKRQIRSVRMPGAGRGVYLGNSRTIKAPLPGVADRGAAGIT